MKVLIVASALVYSSLSFAGYNCSEKDSVLEISNKGASAYALLKVKGAVPVKLKGEAVLKDSLPAYFSVKSYLLKDAEGQTANLKIIEQPIMSRHPCTGRRICDGVDFSKNITAELDYMGKVTNYDCFKTSI